MSKSLRPALLLFVLLLAACGFHPLYDQHSHGDDALAMVQISRLEDRTGQQFNWLLQDRFYGGQAQSTPVWKLDIHLTTDKQELGIRRDSVATRARLTMNATFTLTPLNGQGETLRGSERSFVSYNIFTNPYATRTAEDNATRRGMEELADLVTNRIALYLAGQTRTKTP